MQIADKLRTLVENLQETAPQHEAFGATRKNFIIRYSMHKFFGERINFKQQNLDNFEC